MLKHFFKRIYHFLWYLTAGIILAVAVSATVIRLALTEVDTYRDEIQARVSEYIGHPVIFSEINIGWQGWMPQLSLSDIKFPGRDDKRIISHFNSVRININPLKSLRFKKIISDQLILSGVYLDLTRTKEGAFIIADEKVPGQSGQDFDAPELFSWLLSQNSITLQDTRILWTDEKLGRDTIAFADVALNIKTYRDRVQIDASSKLPGVYGDFLEVKLDANGDLLTPNWSGKIYLAAKNIRLDRFLPVAGLKIDQTDSSFKIWSNWEQAGLADLTGTVSYRDLNMIKNATALSVPKLTADIYAKRVNEDDWSINVDTRELLTGNRSWPEANYAIRLQRDKQKNYGYSAWFEYLNIEDATDFMSAFSRKDSAISSFLNNYRIGGALQNFTISHFPGSEAADLFNYHATFSKSDFIEKGTNTAIYGLSGNLSGNAEQISATIDSEFVTIEAPSYLDDPIWFSAITGRFNWKKFDAFNKLEIPRFQVNTSDFPINLSGSLSFHADQASPFVDIVASSGKVKLEKISDYLPTQMPDKLKGWLSRLFYQGEINSAGMVFRGRPADYPFVKSEGVFKAVFDVENAGVEYYEGWPPIDGVDAEVLVSNSSLDVIPSAGKIYETKIERGQLSVDDFAADRPHVRIDSKFFGDIHDFTLFIEQSPLAEALSLDTVADFNVGGEMKFDLELDIPLKKTNDGSLAADGKIALVDADFSLNNARFSLQNITGSLGFTENSFTANGLDATYYSHPVKAGIHVGKDQPFTFTLQGRADNTFIADQIIAAYPAATPAMPDLQNLISGECEWIVELHKTQNGIDFSLASDMRGLGLDLPAPLGKTEAETRNMLFAGTFGESIISNIRFQYDAHADLSIDTTQEIPAASGKTAGGHSKLRIEGNIETLDVSKWLQVLSDYKDDAAGFKEYEAAINVATLFFLGNEFNNVELSVSSVPDGHKIGLGGESVRGEVFLPDTPLGPPATVDIERLVLSKNASDEESKIDLSPDSLPAFTIEIDTLIYDNIDFGKVDIKASKIDKGIKFEELSLSKASVVISGTGTWHKDPDKNISISVFNFDMYAADIGAMLNEYGYPDSSIEEGELSVALEANWDGTPMDFSLSKLDGVMQVDIGRGKLLDMSSTTSRLFGLLSLHTLPRRLSLDFSDIFGKGFAFNSINGSFNLEHGNAYTDGLIMQGVSAEIAISGRTGLSTKDYDQSAVVTLKISDTLPLAGATLLGLGTGVGAGLFIAGKLFDVVPKQLNKLLSHRYTITGSWDNPVVEPVRIKNEIQENETQGIKNLAH